jgi:hypothetical protein
MLALSASPSPPMPSTPPKFAVIFDEGAEDSGAVVCERVGVDELKCLDLGGFLNAFERVRKAREARIREHEEFKERLQNNGVEL